MIDHSRLTKRRKELPPISVMTLAGLVGIVWIASILLLAHAQPWLGLVLQPAADQGVTVVRSAGPSGAIPVGTVIAGMMAGDRSLALEPLDLTIEPDGSMGDYATYRKFLDRQEILSRIQSSEEITVLGNDGKTWKISPLRDGRPLLTLPAVFWVQLVVGIVAWLVSAAVFAFRPGEMSARYLLLSGASTLLFSPAASLYTTRELALDGTLFHWASDLNFFGGSMFAASFVAMLLHYPRKIAPTWVSVGVVMLYAGWFVLQETGAFESMTFARRFLVVAGVIATFVLAGIHWVLTRRDPVARAALQWFLLSWMLGTCTFCLLVLMPQLFGVDTSPLQGYSFLLFLLVYVGLAFGILRYRLFDLGTWWRRAAVWSIGILMLVLFDLLFLFGLGLSSGMSLSLTLAICGIVWLPLRAWIWNRFSRPKAMQQGKWFGRVIDVALAPDEGKRDALWRDLINDIFDPLNSDPLTGSEAPGIALASSGLALTLPPIGSVAGLRLEYAGGGRRLFTPADVQLAGDLLAALSHALEGRSAYEKGAIEERTRIARDIHDNIGAQLLSALHSGHPDGKDTKIRETIVDLRDVINNIPAGRFTIDETFAELRCETRERLETAGISLVWNNENGERVITDTTVLHALRSIIREAVSNTIRHSSASEIRIVLRVDDKEAALRVEDNGGGIDPDYVREGNGLGNMRSRAAKLGGTLTFTNLSNGLSILLVLPLSSRPEKP